MWGMNQAPEKAKEEAGPSAQEQTEKLAKVGAFFSKYVDAANTALEEVPAEKRTELEAIWAEYDAWAKTVLESGEEKGEGEGE